MNENTVASVESALTLLNIVAEQPGAGLSELARLAGMNKSRVYRLLCTLEQQHFVQRLGEPSTYHLGHQLLVLGVSANRQIDLIGAAESEIERLSLRFDENLQLRIREGREIVQVLRRTSQQALQVRSSVGNRRPLGAGASGRVLLAYAPAQVQMEILAHQPELQTEIEQIRQQGFAQTRGELTAGIYAFATPIFTLDGSCVAALSLSAPQGRVSPAVEADVIQEIKAAAAAISRKLGYGALTNSLT